MYQLASTIDVSYNEIGAFVNTSIPIFNSYKYCIEKVVGAL